MKFKRSSLRHEEAKAEEPPKQDAAVEIAALEDDQDLNEGEGKQMKQEHSLEDLVTEPRSLDDEITNDEDELSGPSLNRPHTFQKPPLNTFNPSHLPSTGVYASKKGGGGNRMHLLILVGLGLLVIGATIYLLKGGDVSSLRATATPAPAPTTAAVATPASTQSTLNRSSIKIRVLNGTTKSGLAGSVAEKLKGLGYQIDKTANATNSAFTQTVVRVKEGSQAATLQETLSKDLSPDYSVSSATSLKEADTVDAEIILGSK
jgi:hypothetical protein